MWLLQEKAAPSFMTIDNFMNKRLIANIEEIFAENNKYIFAKRKQILIMYILMVQKQSLTQISTVGCGKKAVLKTDKKFLKKQ